MNQPTRSILLSCVCLSLITLSTLPGQFAAPFSSQPESAAVSQLRRVLQANYSDPAERDRATKQCLEQLRFVDDLRAAALLREWCTSSAQQETAAVDQSNHNLVTEKFTRSVRRLLRQGEPASKVSIMEMLAQLASQLRIAGEPLTLVHGFAGDLADLILVGPPNLRGLSARTLAEIEPSVYVAVPALTALLQTNDGELRVTAAESLARFLQHSFTAACETRLASRPSSRSDLILMASSVLPVVHHGLEDVRPEIRRSCLETIGIACEALTRLMDEPVGHDDASGRRTLEAEYEELRPLLSALHDLGPAVERSLHNGDPETRILTHKALENLGVARGIWLQRCAARQKAAHERLLSELLQESLPELAGELLHPDVRVRRSALDVLETSGPLAMPALPALSRALHDPDRFVRWSAVRTVGKLGPSAAPQTIADVERMLRDPDEDLRKAAANALENLRSPSGPRP